MYAEFTVSLSYFPESIKRVEEITGKKVTFYQVDLVDKAELRKIFEKVLYSH